MMVPKDFYLQPYAIDPVLPDEVVLGLARLHAPQVQAVTGVDETGGEARTYIIDERLIFKTQRPQQLRPSTSLTREVFFLNQLAAATPDLAVPRVLGYGHETATDGQMVQYTLMTRMPGIAMQCAELDADAWQGVIRRVGTVLRHIHAVPLAPFIRSELFHGDQSFVDTQMRLGNSFNDLADAIRQEHLPWSLSLTPLEVGAKAVASVPRSTDRVPLHSNPYCEHIFVYPKSGLYAGLIDFGDAYISHPAFDLQRWNRPADREALLAGYTSAGPVTDAFLATWRAVMILEDAITIAYDPERAAEAEDDLLALLAEL
jgi:aminoglycoside phosphotransferase (APT) family kinase protein